MHVLIIGGSSGLGLILAKQFSEQGHKVIVTGRTDPKVDFAQFYRLELSSQGLPARIDEFVVGLPEVDICVYSAGFYQEGRITDLSVQQIEDMLDVGVRGMIYVLRALLQKQDKLAELISITSSAQYTPREKEPLYNLVKAGEAMFSSGLAEDGRIGKVLVVAPPGTQTPFWRDHPEKVTAAFLDPSWVVAKIGDARQRDYRYQEIRLFKGDPPKVEVFETR